jgi:hypothetical protein
MLTIQGARRGGFCDGVSRRDFLKIGGLSMVGLSLTDLLALEARAGTRSSHKAIINIFLCGGPPHQDMFDLKPDAPDNIRGEFKPIETNVDGIQICELMPRLAKMADKYTLVRSLVGARDEHTSHICFSGYTFAEFRQGDWPAMGSVMSRLQGPVDPVVPPFVSLSQKMGHTPWANPGESGFLGLAHTPLLPHGQVMQDLSLKGVSTARLADRRRLLAAVDRIRKDADPLLQGTDAITQRAFDMLTSNKVVQALDLDKEDPKLREKYGRGSLKNVDDGGPMWNDGLLASRRLVEAGVRCVTIGYGRWDYHGANFKQLKERLPILDQGVSALIQDIHDRGLDKDVTVILWGEFGRTPKINNDAGRDHWPAVSCALVAGGGMKTGQVIGSTTADGGYADLRPIHYKEMMATLYNRLGIDVRGMPVMDSLDRPHYLLDPYEPIKELI